MTEFFHPAILFFIAAPLTFFVPEAIRKVYQLAVPALGLWHVWSLAEGTNWAFDFLGYNIVLGQIDPLALIFAYIFSIAGFLGSMYMLEIGTRTEYAAAYFYAGSVYGVLFAGDLLTFFVCWEMLTLGAATLVFARRTHRSHAAAMRYILYHVVGGLILFFGVMLFALQNESLAMQALQLGSTATWCIFLGIGVNSAWPFLHVWLSDSYPEATIGGAIFMSALTTKTAIYALTRLFPGTELLIWIGVAMAAFPIFYAVIENDLRKVLAYSLINQLGFMIVGIGIGTPLALNGATAHVFTHVLYKSLLFMSIGAVMHRTGYAKATELGGLYRSMPLTCICCIVGAASISAFPLFSGFVSKSMVMSAAAGEHLTFVWLVLLFAAAGVFHHAGIKIPFFAFFSHDAGHRVKEAPPFMLAAMLITATLCVTLGAFPHQTVYTVLPFSGVEYEPYTTHHVMSQLQLLGFSALAFCLLLLAGIYPAEIRSVNLDADFLYRKFFGMLNRGLAHTLNGLNAACDKVVLGHWVGCVNSFASNAPMKIAKGCTSIKEHVFIDSLAQSGVAPIGVPVLAAVILLAALTVLVF